jgi:hypothetical protein
MGSAELELSYRRVLADYGGHSLADQDLPLRLRAGLCAPADGIVAGTLGAALRIPPQTSSGTSGPFVRGAPVAVEGMLGLEVRL